MAAPAKLSMLSEALSAKTSTKKSKIAMAMDKCDTTLEKLIEVLYAAYEADEPAETDPADKSEDAAKGESD